MADRVGQQLGNYSLVRLLGRGGQAEVYLGEHRYLKSFAALKVLHASLDDKHSEQFLAEAQTLARLAHPSIVRVLDFTVEQGTPVLIMDYSPAGTLRQRYPPGSCLPLATVVSAVSQVASALQYAHTHHVIHRDVKPENLLLSLRDEVLLSDFGLAVFAPTPPLLSTQAMAGTLPYMAPEQLQGHPCFASDQYSLAIVAYEWLCGRRPFTGLQWQLIQQQLYAAPPSLRDLNPSVPLAVEMVILRALAKDPGERYVSVQGFAHALARASQEVQHATEDAEVTAPLHLTHTEPQDEPLASSSYNTQPLPSLAQSHFAQNTQRLRQTPSPSSQRQTKTEQQVSPSTDVNRQRLLAKVRAFWITGVLQHSLHGAALIALGLREQPDAVANPWHLVMESPNEPARALPPGTHIAQAYDEAVGELLILGEPGSGKTTLLLELARTLLDRAEREERHPMPVIFNLSSWANKRQPIEAWLIEELNTKYQVPRKLGKAWVETDQILPLLDGLDEVAPASRAACVEAINVYRLEHGLVPTVVCSRSAQYLAESVHALLRKAVVVQPLTPQQIEVYLASAGEQLEAVRVALRADPVLQELATTPLMLSVLSMAYQDLSVEDILRGGLPTTHRQVFEQYTQRMLERRGGATRYTPQQTMHWLVWLAKQLTQHNQTEFYLERMQPDWLAKGWGHRLYSCSSGGLLGTLFTALVGGVVDGLLGWWTFLLVTLQFGEPFLNSVFAWIPQLLGLPTLVDYYSAIGGLVTGLTSGLLVGLVGGLLVGLFNTREPEIKPVEVVIWSWVTLPRDMIASLVTGLLCVFLLGLFGSPVGVFFSFVQNGQPVTVGVSRFSGSHSPTPLEVLLSLLAGFQQGLIFGLVGGLVSSFLSGKLSTHYPKIAQQGKWESMRIGVIVGLVVWLVGLPLAQLVSILLDKPLGGLLHWSFEEPTKPLGILVGGLIGVVLCVLVGGLTFGLINGFSSGQLEKHLLVLPNQGIRRSAQISLRVGLLAGLTCTLLFGLMWLSKGSITLLIYGESRPYGESLTYGLFTGLVFAPFVGLLVGLFYGGTACIKHVLLRLFLWRMRCIPWHYSRFLDYAAERILLRKVGGGYIFVHRLLLEYFASLDTTPTLDAARAKKEQAEPAS